MTDLTLPTMQVLRAFILFYLRKGLRKMADRKSLSLDELTIGSKSGPYLRLTENVIEAFDRNCVPRFHVLLEGGVYPTLELCDGNGNARIIATVGGNGTPFLTFRDGNFK